MNVLGVHLVGVNWENAHKLGVTLLWIVVAVALRSVTVWLARKVGSERGNGRLVFWTRQVAAVVAALFIGVGLVSIWFDNPSRLALPFGIVTAGVAFALQRVITAVAGYVVILRGKTFSVGDRIEMGGVRGDVIALGLVQTTILEMGRPPQVARNEPPDTRSVWVQARQYTGRVVTVTNDKLFDTPVYNYSRLFSFIWEEIRLPVPYDADRARAEEILLDCARRETLDVRDLARAETERMEREFFVDLSECTPRVYYRLTDNWLELTVRFVTPPRGVREVIDRMTRAILEGLERAGIRVASTTQDIVGLPPLRLEGSFVRTLVDALARPADGSPAAASSSSRANGPDP